MLTLLNQALGSGQSFPLALRFEKTVAVEATVTVKAAGVGVAMDWGTSATTCST
jgi:copper(I)-binding protein